nr:MULTISPECIES: DUF971 domain-containing protein [Myxococcaceae]
MLPPKRGTPAVSFWDRIKPAARPPTATDVKLSPDGRTLTLGWDDGFTTHASAQHLRQQCPCAECVDEWTNKRTLDPSRVPADLAITQVQPVGNYALAFAFGDGHSTGIYHWTHLRELTKP